MLVCVPTGGAGHKSTTKGLTGICASGKQQVAASSRTVGVRPARRPSLDGGLAVRRDAPGTVRLLCQQIGDAELWCAQHAAVCVATVLKRYAYGIAGR